MGPGWARVAGGAWPERWGPGDGASPVKGRLCPGRRWLPRWGCAPRRRHGCPSPPVDGAAWQRRARRNAVSPYCHPPPPLRLPALMAEADLWHGAGFDGRRRCARPSQSLALALCIPADGEGPPLGEAPRMPGVTARRAHDARVSRRFCLSASPLELFVRSLPSGSKYRALWARGSPSVNLAPRAAASRQWWRRRRRRRQRAVPGAQRCVALRIQTHQRALPQHNDGLQAATAIPAERPIGGCAACRQDGLPGAPD